MRSLICLIAFAASLPAQDLKSFVDPPAKKLLESGKYLGFVVGIHREGKDQVFGYGTVKLPGGTATPDGKTIFEIGSMTKSFTGVLLAEGVRRNELKLANPACDSLPADVPLGKAITLEQLATHRSGLPVEPPFLGFMAPDAANPYAAFDRNKLQKLLEKLKPDEPGKKSVYSNLGAGLAGIAAVHAAKARSFDAIVKERITLPLGMDDTTEGLTGAQRAHFAKGHDEQGKPTSDWDFACLEACGGLRSTANDLLRYAAANLGESKAEIAAAMKASHEPRAEMDELTKVGLFWMIGSKRGILWHNGGTGGFHSMLVMHPKTKTAVVLLCAASNDLVDITAFEILEAIQPAK